METQPELLEQIERLAGSGGLDDAALAAILDRVLEHFDCIVGTIHSLEPGGRTLALRAHRGVPETIMDRVARIPVGKGMAGLAAERLEPVQVCNLQTDASGMAKPGARETKMEGSIALPMMHDGALRGTLGVAKPIEYEFDPEEIEVLEKIGESIAAHL